MHSAVLPAVTPDSATDFYGLKAADGASDMGYLGWLPVSVVGNFYDSAACNATFEVSAESGWQFIE